LARQTVTRRAFLAGSALAAIAVMPGAGFARTIVGGMPWLPGVADTPAAPLSQPFLNMAERQCVDAITARLIPSDAAGPGARDAGVVDFIDSQLAGFYGRGERWYMAGPFAEGADTQGYQQEHPPAELYRRAISALDGYCRDQFDGRTFAELDEQEQDGVLTRIDEEELQLDGVSAKAFFDLVLENAIEGFFCDPIHGGNREMVGWRLVGFPGARYDYRDFLHHNGEPLSIEPVSLGGRPAWNSN
jgi:gluconate 2-dehydrogenase gamma chain